MIASEHHQAVGLCSTCNNNPDCFHRARRGPALFCEMFDNYLPVSGAVSRLHSGADAQALEDASSHAGLCVNCENRRICNLPRLAGGIWHCENYE